MNNSKKSILNSNLLMNFPEIEDDRGILTLINQKGQFTWSINRLFFIHNIPRNSIRGSHAHKTLQQFIIAITGNFSVDLYDGITRKTFILKSPSQGIFIPSMVWVEIKDFSENAIALILADQEHDEKDYIRDIHTYNTLINGDVLGPRFK